MSDVVEHGPFGIAPLTWRNPSQYVWYHNNYVEGHTLIFILLFHLYGLVQFIFGAAAFVCHLRNHGSAAAGRGTRISSYLGLSVRWLFLVRQQTTALSVRNKGDGSHLPNSWASQEDTIPYVPYRITDDRSGRGVTGFLVSDVCDRYS